MKALMLASVASMIDQFNMENIGILEELGYQVDVCCNFEFGSTSSKERVNEFKNELKQRNIGTYSVAIPRKISAVKDIVKAYHQVKELIEKNQYDIVHCHSPIGGVIARLACKKQRKKGLRVIYTAHGFHFFHGAPFRNWMIFYPIEKWMSRYTDVLITICKEDFKLAKKRMKAKEVVYSPGIGLNVEKIKNLKPNALAKRETLEIDKQDILLYAIGELNDNKNHRIILEAFAKLKRRDVHFVVCGRGDKESELLELAETLGIKEQVHLLGFRMDAKEWLHEADIFVFPSKREGLSVSLMEAMAAGLPVVCSKIRGNVDLIDDEKGGFLCSSTDSEQFLKGIKYLIEHEEERKNMGDYNQKKIEDFHLDKVKKIMKNVYHSRRL
ncbi:MAG: glycosyltransferase family 4 protein [Lachnospiraceae bacterium]|nr:glycosyltransferase family 4 protein [Lachnospiraceae bacterium]